MAIANPGTDDINSFTTDTFTGVSRQHTEIQEGPCVFPSKMGRLVVPFSLRSTLTLAEFSQAAAAWTPPGDEANEATVLAPGDLLTLRGVSRFCGITISPLTTYGISGKLITSSGDHTHYFACSHQWRLSIGSFESFSEVPEIAMCVCVCLAHVAGGAGEASPIPLTPLDAPLLMPQLEGQQDASYRWPGTNVLSCRPVDSEAQLPSTFVQHRPASTLESEGWCGDGYGQYITLTEWFEKYLVTKASEDATWMAWHKDRCSAIAERMLGSIIGVLCVPELPNGESTSRIVTRHLELDVLAASINALDCGITASFKDKKSRGCRLKFPIKLPGLIVTSNGSFDSSPFPKTAALQAQLLQLLITATTLPKCIACPSVVDTSPVNSTL